MNDHLERILLRELAPACAVVDARGEVVHLSGPIARYLEPPQGPATNNVVDLAREPLRLDVRTALHKAVRERRTIVQQQVAPDAPGGGLLEVVVRPVSDASAADHFLVVFREREAPPPAPGAGAAAEGETDAVARLRAELRATKEHLQTTIEELEASNARLRTSNEELVTVNEELQSANEELQTSQEELQSLNDELGDLNAELSAKVEEVDRANAHLQRAEAAVRASERELREILEAIPQMVWTAGPDGARDHFSRQWIDYTGVPLEELRGAGWVDRVHPDDRARALDAWRDAAAGATGYDVEIRIRRADGVYRWFKSRAVPVRDAAGRVARWFGSSTDIDDAKRVEAALRDADRRKDDFLALLGHELRNPLAPLRNTVEVLRRRPADAALVERSLPIMQRQIAQLARLVEDLLDVERITRGKIAIRRERVDLAALLRATVDDHRPLFTEAGVRVTVDVPDELFALDADPARLAQVVGNLLHNATKFTDAGGATHVTLRRAEGGAAARLSVRDTGIGMDPAFLERAFEPFAQADVATERRRPGLGLGLALVRSVVELHGGSVRASSGGPGRGTEIVVTLPLASGATAAPPARAAGHVGARRVLVVDDNADAAESLAELLDLEGHEVRVAPDGAAGVAAAREVRPDVVLCDIGLPGELDGYGVARALRADPATAGAYLVALTGYASADHQRRAREAGFDRHVPKPPSLDVLNEIMAAAGKRKA